MKTINATITAWRRPGTAITIILLGLIALRQARAGQVNITLTGVLTGGWDTKGLFFQGNEAKNLGKKPFTLVFTFDDSKGFVPDKNCASGRHGSGPGSPGVAVLTMGNGWFRFGGNDNFESGIFRACDGSMLSLSVNRKPSSTFDHTLGINVRVVPSGRVRAWPPSSDWRSPMSTTDVDTQSSCLIIADSMNGGKEVKTCFDVKKVEISAGK